MKKFEYMRLRLRNPSSITDNEKAETAEDRQEERINTHGSEGWELVSVAEEKTWITYYFKRELEH